MTIPNKVDRYLVPNRLATMPEVGGTVESHKSPITQLNTIITKLVVGKINNRNIAILRVKYIKDNTNFFLIIPDTRPEIKVPTILKIPIRVKPVAAIVVLRPFNFAKVGR